MQVLNIKRNRGIRVESTMTPLQYQQIPVKELPSNLVQISLSAGIPRKFPRETELELELIQTQMAQKPMLRAEVGMRVRCANKASAE